MISPTTRIFVAGHRGMIGSALERVFWEKGYRNLITATRQELDLRSSADVQSFFKAHQPEVVLLGAGRVGGIIDNRDHPADLIIENLSIQASVFSASLAVESVATLVYFGSSCMYPPTAPQPMAEDILFSQGPELSSLPYATAKLAGIISCQAINRQHVRPRCLGLIPASGYGPNDNFDPESAHVLAALIGKLHRAKICGQTSLTLWGSGTPRREFIFSEDIADAVEHLLRSQEIPGGPLNVGSGKDISIRELSEIVAQVVGYQGTIDWDLSKPDGAPRKLLDSRQIQSTGWFAPTPLAEGIRRTYAGFLGGEIK